MIVPVLNFITTLPVTPPHRRLQYTHFMSCLWDSKQAKIGITLHNIWIKIVFKLTLLVSIVDFESCYPILITEVHLPPGPVGRVSPVRVGTHAASSTVFLYPVHCLVWRPIIEHTRVLLCRLFKGNIGTCNRVALSLPDCIYYWNRLFRRVFFSLNAFQIIVISGMYVCIHSIRISFWQFQ